MLVRTLEPEVMDTEQEARDYDSMDHSAVNRQFVDDLLSFSAASGYSERVNSAGSWVRVLDVGTGTALIPIELCQRPIQTRIVAIDLAHEMLRLAERNVASAGLEHQIQLEHVDAKGLPFDEAEFDWVISNSIIHHIPEPMDCIREMHRVLKPGGILFVRDLLRPESASDVESLVTTYAGNENHDQQQLFRQSLHAALTVSEMSALIQSLGWSAGTVTQTSDRHWTLGAVKR